MMTEINKVGCVLPMIVVSMLPQAEIGRNNYREGAPYLNISHVTGVMLHYTY